MGLFSTRNSDGVAVLSEPLDTVPAHVSEGLARQARRHSCTTRAELFSAPGLGDGAPHGFDTARAGEN